ncbi:MAG: hypothetical protein A4E38_01849 [Methanoregulaceae archaeon PtaB.Bin108]|nr:MAG: hypothetical protein A4E38_01849 [Methanoregulaceae archaeon PtaB.Bin108]
MLVISMALTIPIDQDKYFSWFCFNQIFSKNAFKGWKVIDVFL